MEELAAQTSARAGVIKEAENRVMNANRDMEKAYEEQRAKIQSVFKKVSFSLFHVNAFFLYIMNQPIRVHSVDMVEHNSIKSQESKVAQSLTTP